MIYWLESSIEKVPKIPWSKQRNFTKFHSVWRYWHEYIRAIRTSPHNKNRWFRNSNSQMSNQTTKTRDFIKIPRLIFSAQSIGTLNDHYNHYGFFSLAIYLVFALFYYSNFLTPLMGNQSTLNEWFVLIWREKYFEFKSIFKFSISNSVCR